MNQTFTIYWNLIFLSIEFGGLFFAPCANQVSHCHIDHIGRHWCRLHLGGSLSGPPSPPREMEREADAEADPLDGDAPAQSVLDFATYGRGGGGCGSTWTHTRTHPAGPLAPMGQRQ